MKSTIPFHPKLTVNRTFMQEFISAEPPCLGLGMMEEQGHLNEKNTAPIQDRLFS